MPGFQTTICGVACFTLLLADTETVFTRRKGKPSKSAQKVKSADWDALAPDRIVLRDGKELFGQVTEASSKSALTVIARRAWLKDHFPDRMEKWQEAEKVESVTALVHKRQRLELCRRDRPSVPASNDRIISWVERELAKKFDTPVALMVTQLGRGKVSIVQKRGDQASRALSGRWVLELQEPQAIPFATPLDSIDGRGLSLELGFCGSILMPGKQAVGSGGCGGPDR